MCALCILELQYMPKEFCDKHLPDHDDSIILVDEDEKEYLVKYVLLRNKLDGGWRGFANVHKLVDGDAMVFHLIGHCRFKVTFTVNLFVIYSR